MKKQFNNDGVYALQKELFAMSESDRRKAIQQVRVNFRLFMLNNFDLSARQEEQVMHLHGALLSELSEGVANTWENMQVVSFQKDAKPEGQTFKDIILPPRVQQYSRQSHTVGPIALSVYIRYRTE